MTDKKKKNSWYIAGLHFKCSACGRCCSGPDEGVIWITQPEIELVAELLKIPVDELRQKYLKRLGSRTTIIEEPVTKDCIFLRRIGNDKNCDIYTARPNQCRTWPFWSSNLTSPNQWNTAAMKCKGINRGRVHSFEEIEKLRKQKSWWTQDV